MEQDVYTFLSSFSSRLISVSDGEKWRECWQRFFHLIVELKFSPAYIGGRLDD